MKWKILSFLVLIILGECFVPVGHSACSGEIDMITIVTEVIDGDTFDTTSGDRIRLGDIDAPEKNKSGYEEGKKHACHGFQKKIFYVGINY